MGLDVILMKNGHKSSSGMTTQQRSKFGLAKLRGTPFHITMVCHILLHKDQDASICTIMVVRKHPLAQ